MQGSAALIIAIGLLSPLAARGDHLSQPVARARFDEAFTVGEVLPKWSRNVLISWRSRTESADNSHNIRVHDRSGKVVGRYRLWFPGASYVKIWDAASDGKDGVVVVGIALDGSGQLVGYLAIISLSVNSARIIATSPFEGQNVVYGADGSIWILGFETSDSQRKITTSTPHALLHHLTSSGQLISKHLPWPEVGCGFHPLVGEAAMMTAIGDGVGIYMPACRSWFELTSSGDLANRLPVQLPNSYNSKNATFWNVFVTKDRRVFAYVNHPGHVASNGTAVANGVFSLRKDTGLWDPIDDRAALTAGEINWLAGTDENRLVCAVGANELIWVDTLP